MHWIARSRSDLAPEYSSYPHLIVEAIHDIPCPITLSNDGLRNPTCSRLLATLTCVVVNLACQAVAAVGCGETSAAGFGLPHLTAEILLVVVPVMASILWPSHSHIILYTMIISGE